MHVTITETPYVTAHAKAPRGRGYWGFCPANCWNTADYLNHVFWFSGTFADAKAAARRHFAAAGVAFVVVCS